MTIEKGRPWGTHGDPPADAVTVFSDGQARAVIEAARASGSPPPPLLLRGGDLAKTLGRVREGAATVGVTFPIDLGIVTVDGVERCFVAHAVARSRLWREAVVAMNAQWIGSWNLGPRSHPNDGRLDIYETTLRWSDLRKVRARLPSGAHLPHPRIAERHTTAIDLHLRRHLPLWLDGEPVGMAERLSFRVEPDAVQVAI